MKKLYIANLPYKATEEELKQHFSQCGQIKTLTMINDKETKRFRGFCFIEVEDDLVAGNIKLLNGTDFCGRKLVVKDAIERQPR